MYDAATFFAWFVMAFLFLLVVGIIVMLGSLPKKIALQRNHPQVDAINAASWMGLLLGGVGWIVAFVWAFLRTGPVGHPEGAASVQSLATAQDEIAKLRQQVAELERERRELKAARDER